MLLKDLNVKIFLLFSPYLHEVGILARAGDIRWTPFCAGPRSAMQLKVFVSLITLRLVAFLHFPPLQS